MVYIGCSKTECGRFAPQTRPISFAICINDPGMRENELKDIIKRLKSVFGDRTYKQRVDKSDKRWLDDRIEDIFARIVNYLEGIL